MSVRVTEEPAVLETDAMKTYDVLLLNYFKRAREGCRLLPKQEEGLLSFLAGGKGLVVVHVANWAFREVAPGWAEYPNVLGGAWEDPGHDTCGPFIAKLEDRQHPVTEGMDDFETTDELYYGIRTKPGVHILASAVSKVKATPQPIAWLWRYANGRVFGITLGHDLPAMQNPSFIQLLVKGTSWAAGKL